MTGNGTLSNTRTASLPDVLTRLQKEGVVARHVEGDALMASCEQPPHHIGAHSSQADHCELHDILLHQNLVRRFQSANHAAVAANQVVGRTIVVELGGGLALELGNDALRQHLAEFDAPLIERIDVPDHALSEDGMLIERDQFA